MSSPLGAAKYNSLLQGAASLDRLGNTDLDLPYVPVWLGLSQFKRLSRPG